MRLLLIYLAAVNLAAFLAFGLDKGKARRHRWRIPEATLLGLAWAGGAVGAGLGMLCFHHKTQKGRFCLCVPLALVLWASGLLLLCRML